MFLSVMYLVKRADSKQSDSLVASIPLPFCAPSIFPNMCSKPPVGCQLIKPPRTAGKMLIALKTTDDYFEYKHSVDKLEPA